MWLLFALLALLAFALADVLGKQNIDKGNSFTFVEMIISTEIFIFFVGLVLFVLRIGESGRFPWQILGEHPLIILNLFCFIAYWLLLLLSFRYIGLSVEAAVSGTSGFLYFLGLLLVNAVSGKLTSVNELLHPMRLIPALFMLFFVFLLPNVEVIFTKKTGMALKRAKKDSRRTIIGILILLLALFFDACDSLITTLIFDSNSIGLIDYLIAAYFVTIVPILFFSIILWRMSGKLYIPFKKDSIFSTYYALVAVLSSLTYLFASSLDAVRTGIIFIAAPIFPIIGAKVFLKEKYTWRQYFCIGIITISAIVFCAADYVI